MRLPAKFLLAPIGLFFAAACGEPATAQRPDPGPDGGAPPDSGPPPANRMGLDFPSIDVAAGGEILEMCESITLHNAEPIYVNRVAMTAGPAWHHSNWFFVPDSMYDGPDGLWPCADRKFEEFKTGPDGGILFAQSTQARAEVEQFQAGTAVVIPRNARMIGNIHLVNATGSPISTKIRLEIDTLDAADVKTRLASMSIVYFPLDLPPHAKSRFTGHCAVQDGPLDFRLYYVLPHFHGFGRTAQLDVAGGPLGARTVFSMPSSMAGDPLGKRLDPPVDLRGVTNVTFSCSYENTTDAAIKWGNAKGEMCVLLGFTDSPRRWVGAVEEEAGAEVTKVGDTVMNDAPCVFLAR